MGIRTFVVGFGTTLVLTVVFLAFGDQRPKLRTLVTETHRQLKNNFQNFKDRLDEAATIDETLESGDEFLSLLGLGRESQRRCYPDDVWTNTTLPVIVSYVNSVSLSQAVGLAINVQKFLRNHTLLLYDLGLTNRQLQTLAAFCNSSKCLTVPFDLSKFPAHVADRHLHAFRPLIIQDAMSKSGAVFYLDNDQRLTTRDISPLVTRAASTGALSWRGSRPVTTLTHPRMLRYLASKSTTDSLLFTPMVLASRLVLYNTPEIRDGLMLPWVKCSLIHDCILPLGAQSVGCHFDKKPVYRYSGCHKNDASALSVLLGLVFKFDTDKYSIKSEEEEPLDTATDSSSLSFNSDVSTSSRSFPSYHHSSPSPDGSYFRRIDLTEATLELNLLLDNSTDSSYGT